MIAYDLLNFDSEGHPCKVLDMLAHNGEYFNKFSLNELEILL
jgi:hypothetical protein